MLQCLHSVSLSPLRHLSARCWLTEDEDPGCGPCNKLPGRAPALRSARSSYSTACQQKKEGGGWRLFLRQDQQLRVCTSTHRLKQFTPLFLFLEIRAFSFIPILYIPDREEKNYAVGSPSIRLGALLKLPLPLPLPALAPTGWLSSSRSELLASGCLLLPISFTLGAVLG